MGSPGRRRGYEECLGPESVRRASDRWEWCCRTLRLVAEPDAASQNGQRIGIVNGQVFVTDTGLRVVVRVWADGFAVLFVAARGHASGAVGEVEATLYTVRVVDCSDGKCVSNGSNLTEKEEELQGKVLTSLLYQ